MTTSHRLSLNALRAFEATARLRSFSAAAEELSVTHGAVSRHIRMLEDSLGLALLQRTAQGATPTGEGQRLAEGLSKAFGLIQSSVEQDRKSTRLNSSHSQISYAAFSLKKTRSMPGCSPSSNPCSPPLPIPAVRHSP